MTASAAGRSSESSGMPSRPPGRRCTPWKGSDPYLALQYLQSLGYLGRDGGRDGTSGRAARAAADAEELEERLEELDPEELELLRRKFEELQLMREMGLVSLGYDPEEDRVVERYPFRVAPAGEALEEETREKLGACLRAAVESAARSSDGTR